MRCLIAALSLLSLLWLAGCATNNGGRMLAQELAQGHGLEPVAYTANGFTMRGFLRVPPHEVLRDLVVYIEGDGHAYLDRHTPSSDPTPENPMALRLALADPASGLLYLGRPCQFSQGEPCSPRYWTMDRYAPVVVEAMNRALDQAKAQTGARRLFLAGYSGGGAMAALLAARRADVAGLATVAGNLDHNAWTSLHHVTPLRGSLNPADDASSLATLHQVHFVGENDQIMPTRVVQSFLRKLGENTPARLVIVKEADHACCWPKTWPGLLRKWGTQWGREDL